MKAFAVGTLSAAQLTAINAARQRAGYPLITAEVIFLGTHLYRSRVSTDGSSIEDVIEQIVSAMGERAIVIATQKMTAMQSQNPRADCYGNMVHDMVVFECTTRHPRPEIYSVIPKGALKKPKDHP